MNRKSGFTLIELIITVALVAIVMTIGIPSFRTAILNNSRTAQVNEFVGVLSLARSEAAKRGFRVTVCRRLNDTTCATDTTSIWENGWIVFIDQNRDNIIDAGEEVLKIYSPIPNDFTLRGNVFSKSIAYLPNGVGSEAGTFRLCDSRGVDQARFVVISMTGRVRVREKESGDTCP
ncbi:MAG TPA: GspH/FimT family pseudopilin [Candidatus Competibacter sp.]|nr:GspH/FimT family pseudopilin [Candidatus Competibacteraceae bacterium]HRW65200.1 GspH/FimT family pseudopilin [Candidatus Competibacter sp.]